VKKTMGRKATYIVLKNEDRERLTTLVKTGAHKSRQIQRAQILLLNDKGQDIKSIMAILDICRPNVSYILSDYRKKGLSAALNAKPRSGAPPKITAELEAHIRAISCTDSPEGTKRWTLALLKDKVIKLNYIWSISDESIRTILKKANSNLG
jgi:putative transposase